MSVDNIFIKGNSPKLLIIEPFYGGSHKELINNLLCCFSSYILITLPAKKWHWRSRCGALCFASLIPKITTEKVLFCSSVLNLAELIGMRPDLSILRKVIYFHENQLVYPVQEIKNRDIQYPYNQITSCVAADVILFNSNYNRDTFLSHLKKITKLIPNYRPVNLEMNFKEKSTVLYFPIAFPEKPIYKETVCKELKITWPHRWEFDKGPDDFFNTLFRLKSDNFKFKLIILGESYGEIPNIISLAKEKLKSDTIYFGYMEDKQEYFKALSQCDIAVSTSKHEFFGVAMLEAVYCGCFPLVPNRLVYPEIYPTNCLYLDIDDLYERLKFYCQFPPEATKDRANLNLDLDQYSTEKLVPELMKLLTSEPI